MQFKIGDRVVHPAHGTVQIVNIEEKRFSEKKTGLYYEGTLPKFTLWVPVETEESSGLRWETAKNKFDQHPDLLKSPLAPYKYKPPATPLVLVSRLKQGAVQGMRKVVPDAWGWRKSYRPDRFAHLAADTGEPLSRMGDDG
jgi:RNA polymerase-interacting CarD/CdnL/TRCF family regulator